MARLRIVNSMYGYCSVRITTRNLQTPKRNFGSKTIAGTDSLKNGLPTVGSKQYVFKESNQFATK